MKSSLALSFAVLLRRVIYKTMLPILIFYDKETCNRIRLSCSTYWTNGKKYVGSYICCTFQISFFQFFCMLVKKKILSYEVGICAFSPVWLSALGWPILLSTYLSIQLGERDRTFYSFRENKSIHLYTLWRFTNIDQRIFFGSKIVKGSVGKRQFNHYIVWENGEKHEHKKYYRIIPP